MPAPFMYAYTLTASGLVFTGPGLFGGYLIELDGANDQDVTFYDNTAGSGTIIKPTATIDGLSEDENGVILTNPVVCTIGLYCVIAGGGVRKVVVYYNTKAKHM